MESSHKNISPLFLDKFQSSIILQELALTIRLYFEASTMDLPISFSRPKVVQYHSVPQRHKLCTTKPAKKKSQYCFCTTNFVKKNPVLVYYQIWTPVFPVFFSTLNCTNLRPLISSILCRKACKNILPSIFGATNARTKNVPSPTLLEKKNSTSLHNKTVQQKTFHNFPPVLLCATKLALKTFQCFFFATKLDKKNISQYKNWTTKLAQSTSQFFFVLEACTGRFFGHSRI